MSAAATSTEPRLPQPGDRIAERYVVESRLAMGGMGAVVVARHELLGERFAIKVLKPDLLGTQDFSRFLREAQACVGLRGEHAVRVFDVGTLPSGLPFMVMELLDGHDLRRELEQRGALPVEEATTWAIEACHALAEAHARGIVHRDIKPGNLFLATQPDGRRMVKVVDFGISKVLGEPISEQSPKLTQTLGLLGSPQYMSPEQVRSASRVDHRTDIWSLGCVLYELLTNVAPFAGESVSSVSAMIVVDEPTPLDRLRPALPKGLVSAVMRCLSKDRELRVQSVAELAELLSPYALGGPGTSERVLNILRAGNGPPSPRPSARASWPGTGEVETLANFAPLVAVRGDEPAVASAPRSAAPAEQPEMVASSRSTSRARYAVLGGAAALCVALAVGVLVGLQVKAKTVAASSSAPSAQPVTPQRVAIPLVHTNEETRRELRAEQSSPNTATRLSSVPQAEEPQVAPSAVPTARPLVPNSGGPLRPVPPATVVESAVADPKLDPDGSEKLDDILSDRH